MGAGAGEDFRAADENARIDAGEIADQGENDDDAEAEAPRAAERRPAARAATILDIRRLGSVFPFHGGLPAAFGDAKTNGAS
jgi:hypothetical protein